jgi:fucose permease
MTLMSALLGCVYLAATALLSGRRHGAVRQLLSLQLAVLAGIGILVPFAGGWVATHLAAEPAQRVFALAVAGIALAFAALMRPVRTMSVAAPPAAPGAASLARWPDLAQVALLTALHVGADTAIFCWSPSLLDARGPAAVPSAWVLSGFALSALVGRSLLAAMPERFWERRLLVAPGVVAAALLLAVLLGAPGFGATFVLLVAACSCYGLEYPALLGFIARGDPAGFPLKLSATAAGGAVGGWLVTALIALAAPSSGLAAAMLIAPACLVAFSLLAWSMSNGGRRAVAAA